MGSKRLTELSPILRHVQLTQACVQVRGDLRIVQRRLAQCMGKHLKLINHGEAKIKEEEGKERGIMLYLIL